MRFTALKAGTIVLIVLLVLALAQTQLPYSDGQKSRNEFVASIKSFPCTIPNDRKNKLLKNYAQLRVGMNKAQIAALVGPPDYSRVLRGPIAIRIIPEMNRKSNWVYHLYMQDKYDYADAPMIVMFFKSDETLELVAPNNIKNLSEIGVCCDSK